MQARKAVRQAVKKAAPAPVVPPPQKAPAPKPVIARPPPVATSTASPAAAGGSIVGRPASAKGKERAVEAIPSPVRPVAKHDTARQTSQVSKSSGPRSDVTPVAGPSRVPSQAQPVTSGPSKAKAPQIISSLFSYNPSLPQSVGETSAAPVGAPSNAPLVGDTSTFEGLGLDPLLVRHLKGKMSVERPTGIQRSALPYMISAPLDLTASWDDTGNEDEDDYESRTAAVADTSSRPRDIFIQSQTGSGKTLTYLLPIIQTLLPLSRLSWIDRSIGTMAIILAPTRELAQQISQVLERILTMSLASEDDDSHMTRWLVSGLLTGGSTKTHEKAKLRKGVPIIVATPGRLLDHLQNTASFKCAKTMFLVLDEADRLMDLGFEETIQGIIKALDARRRTEIRTQQSGSDEAAGIMKWPYWPRGRQTILCSATVDAKVEKLAGTALENPMVFRGTVDTTTDSSAAKKGSKVDQAVEAAMQEANAISLPSASEDKFTPPSQLAQKFVVVPTKLRLVCLIALLRSLVSPKKQLGDSGTKVIVFLSSTDAVDYHWKMLGGVQMGGEAQAPSSTQVEGQEPAVGQSSGSRGDSSTDSSKQTKSTGKSSNEEQVSLSSPLFPSTTVHRLHGSLPLRTRLASLASFAASSATPSILLATSVASRGLDLPLVRAVIQYDLPTEGGANEYVHRVGRTARAGKGGEAWAFVGPSERDWVGWVEAKMGGVSDGAKPVKLGEDRVEDLLKRGFGGKGFEYEGRATEVQLALERWVLADEPNAALARKAYSSFIRAYSTHPLEEKKFFHPKSLHLGHLAKSFALREAPGALSKPTKPIQKAGAGGKDAKAASGQKRKRGADADGSDYEESEPEKGGKETTARNETERRMYEAVRKAGRSIRSGGKLGEFGNAKARDAEFHVMGTGELEKMLGGKMP